MYYTIPLDLAMGVAYLCLLFFMPYLIHGTYAQWSQVRWSSILLGICFALAMWAISIFIPDPELANRRLHAMGGGVAIALVYHLAVVDSQTRMRGFQYCVIGLMICNMAGIANELAEHLIQSTTTIVFAPTIVDTRLDLRSNIVGSTLAVLIGSYFYSRHTR